MNRDLSNLADARAEITRFLATNPNHKLAESLGVMLRATAPITLEEALPVLIENANTIGKWSPIVDDIANAKAAIEGRHWHPWGANIRAQWASIQHFFGRAE